MSAICQVLIDLEKALLAIVKADPRRHDDAILIRRYRESIRWKMDFFDHHCGLVTSFPWGQVCREDITKRNPLPVIWRESAEFKCEIGEERLVDLLTYIALDGAVGACVNAADTLGRMLNLAFKLDLNVNSANLWKVARRVSEDSPLGIVFKHEPGIGWMDPLRRLRGECQHGHISGLLTRDEDYIGAPLKEPFVSDTYCGMDGESQRLSVFISSAGDNTMRLLTNASRAVIAYGDNAISGGQ